MYEYINVNKYMRKDC